MGITAKELARLLNLSEAAVSLALNNRPGVSTATRKRIWDKAQELGLEPPPLLICQQNLIICQSCPVISKSGLK